MTQVPPHDPNYPYTERIATPPAYPQTAEGPAPVRGRATREVTAGSFRFGIRDGLTGTIGIFAILGVVLGILGFAAAFSLDEAAQAGAGGGGLDAADAAAALPALLVSVLPFLAAPLLALGLGCWAGHASRDPTIGLVSGAIGCFVGPIVMLLLTGVGFALGAGAAGLDLSNVNVQAGIAPGWGTTIPYLFTGAGLLWLLANTVAGALAGFLFGGILADRWGARDERRRTYARGTPRY